MILPSALQKAAIDKIKFLGIREEIRNSLKTMNQELKLMNKHSQKTTPKSWKSQSRHQLR